MDLPEFLPAVPLLLSEHVSEAARGLQAIRKENSLWRSRIRTSGRFEIMELLSTEEKEGENFVLRRLMSRCEPHEREKLGRGWQSGPSGITTGQRLVRGSSYWRWPQLQAPSLRDIFNGEMFARLPKDLSNWTQHEGWISPTFQLMWPSERITGMDFIRSDVWSSRYFKIVFKFRVHVA